VGGPVESFSKRNLNDVGGNLLLNKWKKTLVVTRPVIWECCGKKDNNFKMDAEISFQAILLKKKRFVTIGAIQFY